MAAAHVLGACVCPWCKSPRASVRLSAKGLAYVNCDGCQTQTFGRSAKSDQLMRDAITAPPAPAPAAPTPAAPAAAMATPITTTKEPASGPAWGFKW